ncbi:MAG: hypothetical protein D6748_01020 [Calditrichaeota bacterium]|nr:MAG: hypothetical protein D6748_01020 [Calditrichota bacterium]
MKRGYWFLFGFMLFLMSCAGSRSTEPATTELVIFPPPPDTTRIQFLTRISNSRDIEGKQSAFSKFIKGETPGKEIIKPYGITLHKGKIYICDTIFAGLEIIDLINKTFDYFQPGGKGLLKKPVNCTTDEQGRLYITDTGRQQVVIFDEQLHYLNAIGDPKKMKPVDVAVAHGKIWFSDMPGHKIHVYDQKTLKHLYSFPDAEYSTPEFLYSPTNLEVTEDLVYVTDFGDFKVKKYTLDGKFVSSVGSYGKGLGQFVRPKGIAVDHEGNLYVVDAGFENIQIFDKNNRLLMFFGGEYKGPGYMWLPAQVYIDYEHLDLFAKYVDESFNLKYLIFVTNQYGPDKINVYGFVEPKQQISASQ